MSAFPLELLAILIAGGMAQAVLLVVLQALYLKRSSIGVRLESLRTEVARRDSEIRHWVRDSLAQIEADSITRDTDLRRDLMNTRSEIREIVQDVIRSEETARALAQPIGAQIITQLLESKAVRREVAAMEQLGAAIRSGKVRLEPKEE